MRRLTGGISSAVLAEIVAHELGHTLGFGHSSNNTALMYANVTGLGASLRPDQLAYAKKLKWIHSTAAGVNQLMYPELKNSAVLVTNPSGLFSPGMGEHVIGMMVLLARNFMDSVRYQDKGVWAQNEVSSIPGEITELSARSSSTPSSTSCGFAV